MPGSRIYHSSQQLIPDGTWTEVALGSELSDLDRLHNTTNNERITVGAAGFFFIAFHAAWTFETVAQVRGIRINKNGTALAGDYTYNAYPAAYHWTHSMCCMDLLVPGDFITVQVLQEDADLTGGLRSVGYNTPHLTIAGG